MGFFDKYFSGEEKEQGRFFKYALIATGIFLVYVTFLSSDNLIHWIRSGMELRQQEREMGRYRREIGRMEEKIDSLSNDTETLERFAREQFHFCRPDEDVYLIEEE